jgi:hypothetical protein
MEQSFFGLTARLTQRTKQNDVVHPYGINNINEIIINN